MSKSIFLCLTISVPSRTPWNPAHGSVQLPTRIIYHLQLYEPLRKRAQMHLGVLALTCIKGIYREHPTLWETLPHVSEFKEQEGRDGVAEVPAADIWASSERRNSCYDLHGAQSDDKEHRSDTEGANVLFKGRQGRQLPSQNALMNINLNLTYEYY